MKVREAIEYLQQYPEDSFVFILVEDDEPFHSVQLHGTWSEVVPVFKVGERIA